MVLVAGLLLLTVLNALVALRERAARGTGMVRIEGGTFVTGSDDLAWERPRRTLKSRPFHMDRNLVTNVEYLTFVGATGYATKGAWSPEQGRVQPDHPVVSVTWEDANAYAAWRGKRLPTEAEWEKAARGPQGNLWPWGNRFDPLRSHFGAYDSSPAGDLPDGASPYGLLDMVGTVFQWTSDCVPTAAAEHHAGGRLSDTRRPTSHYVVVKGGCRVPRARWSRAPYFYVRPSTLDSYLIGFRCAADEGVLGTVAPSQVAGEGTPSHRGPRPEDYPAQAFEESARQVLEASLIPNRMQLADHIMRFMDLRPAQRVADIGCGVGFFTFVFSRAVGGRGKVYAVDIEPDVLEFVREVAPRWALPNVRTVHSRFNDISLPAGSVEHVMLYPTYAYLVRAEDPPFGESYRKDVVPFLASCRRALVPGGRLSIFNESWRVGPDTVIPQVERNGFRLLRRAGPGQQSMDVYSLLFEKASRPVP